MFITKEKVNKKIYRLFLEDQRDRSAAELRAHYKKNDWEELAERDKNRRKRILQILKNRKLVFSGQDYFMAGMIFQHGPTISDSKKAISLAKKGARAGNNNAKWLYAAATDRLLIRQNKKQKFGTQYQKKNNRWQLNPVDKKTTDEERAKYNVLSLKESHTRAEDWNKKGIDPWEQK